MTGTSKPHAGPQRRVVHKEALKTVNHDATQTTDPKVEALVIYLIGRIADKWTMIIIDVLADHGEIRFTRLGELCCGISQKMLTQTLRQMEPDGLLARKIYPVIPPKVEYKLTKLGLSLGAAFCGVWKWAAANLPRIEASRTAFDRRTR